MSAEMSPAKNITDIKKADAGTSPTGQFILIPFVIKELNSPLASTF